MFDVRQRGRQSKRRALQATLVVVALVGFLWGLGGTAEAGYGFVFRPSAGAPHSVFAFAFTAPFDEDVDDFGFRHNGIPYLGQYELHLRGPAGRCSWSDRVWILSRRAGGLRLVSARLNRKPVDRRYAVYAAKGDRIAIRFRAPCIGHYRGRVIFFENARRITTTTLIGHFAFAVRPKSGAGAPG